MLLLAPALTAHAELPACAVDMPSTPTLHLVTISPGAQPFSYCGHSALWLRDPKRHIDHILEFGAIDSGAQEPLSGLMAGTLQCTWWVQPVENKRRTLERNSRTAIAQQLSMSPEALEGITRDLHAIARDPDRSYPFHWRARSCSSEIRDLLTTHLPELREQLTDPAPQTARQEGLRHLAPHIWAWLSWHALSGPQADAPMDVWESLFVPVRLREHADRLVTRWPDGQQRPLVAETCLLVQGTHPWPAESPPQRTGGMLAAGLALGGGLVALSRSTRLRIIGGGLWSVLGVLLGGRVCCGWCCGRSTRTMSTILTPPCCSSTPCSWRWCRWGWRGRGGDGLGGGAL